MRLLPADEKSWPPREQQQRPVGPLGDCGKLLASATDGPIEDWRPSWFMNEEDGGGEDDLADLPTADATVPVASSANPSRARVRAEPLVAGFSTLTPPPTGADSEEFPVPTGVLVGSKAPEPQACVSFGLRALQVINKCQPIIERYAATEGEGEELLSEIEELKKRFCGPALLRAHSRHRRFSLTNDSKRLLKQWFNDHIEHPYPTQREKDALARSAGLSLKQINDWFTNYRKRHWEADLVDQQYADLQ